MPKVTNSGKTYTFTLRKGIKFSNGKAVTVADVLGTFQRLFKVSEPQRRLVVQRHRRGAGVRDDAGDLHAEGWRRGERGRPTPSYSTSSRRR